MKLGHLILRRFNGEEHYPLTAAILSISKVGTKTHLTFSVETAEATKVLPDTQSLHAMPQAEAIVKLKGANADRIPAELVGIAFEVPSGNDKDGDWVGRLYYCEHADLNDNNIQVLERADSFFHVRWTGSTIDVNYYDGSKPETEVEIDGWFELKA